MKVFVKVILPLLFFVTSVNSQVKDGWGVELGSGISYQDKKLDNYLPVLSYAFAVKRNIGLSKRVKLAVGVGFKTLADQSESKIDFSVMNIGFLDYSNIPNATNTKYLHQYLTFPLDLSVHLNKFIALSSGFSLDFQTNYKTKTKLFYNDRDETVVNTDFATEKRTLNASYFAGLEFTVLRKEKFNLTLSPFFRIQFKGNFKTKTTYSYYTSSEVEYNGKYKSVGLTVGINFPTKSKR